MRLKWISAWLFAVLVTAVPASADYTVWSCRGPDGTPVSTAAWRAGGTDGTRADTCASGGALQATLPATTTARAATGFAVAVPAGQTIASARLQLTASTDGGGFQAGAALGTPYFSPVLQGGCTDGAAPCSVGGEQTVNGPIDALTIVVRCFDDDGCAAGAGPQVALTQSTLDFADSTPPEISVTGPGRATITDAGGGVRTTALIVDGKPSTPNALCAEPYTVPAPCPATTDATFALPAGTHRIAIEATDAGGLVTRGPEQTVASVTGVSLPARIAVPATVRGRAAPGARVVLEQRAFGTRRWRPYKTVTARDDGSLTFRADGSSREVRAGTQVADLVAPLALALVPHPGTVRNNHLLTLTGRVTGAGGTAVPVTIQAIVRGRWQDIGHTTAHDSGAVVWRHRLTGSTQAATYTFRLRAPRTAGLPWKTATSPRRAVKVRP